MFINTVLVVRVQAKFRLAISLTILKEGIVILLAPRCNGEGKHLWGIMLEEE